MDVRMIIEALAKEHRDLGEAIAVLERLRGTKSRRGRKKFTEAGRVEHSKRLTEAWAKKKKKKSSAL